LLAADENFPGTAFYAVAGLPTAGGGLKFGYLVPALAGKATLVPPKI